MNAEKRVVQISLDIVVGSECDGEKLANDVSYELNRRGFGVVGAGFTGDMTEYYEEELKRLKNDFSEDSLVVNLIEDAKTRSVKTANNEVNKESVYIEK